MSKLQDFLNSPVSTVSAMRKGAKAGDLFGLELECEGRRVDWDGASPDLIKDWAPHEDGSLRKNHGSSQEWVFNGPVKYEKSVERVNKLFDYFDKRGAKLVCSNRTSFHVHFNMGDKNAYQLVNLFILFTILEDIMDAYCGEDRNGNLFCLSSRHAEEQVRWVQDSCFKHMSFANFQENQRYCSLNMAAINKFGTVEFRAMRGLDNREDVLAWLDILKEFCEYACYTMKNPATLIEEISVKTPKGFLREVFSAKSYKLLTAGVADEKINGSIYEGLRLVQMLCYRIGTEFEQVRLRGKDFWASFSDGANEEPILDVAPEQLINAGGLGRPRAPRQAPGLAAAFARGRPVQAVDAEFGEALDAAMPAPPVGVVPDRPLGWDELVARERQAQAERRQMDAILQREQERLRARQREAEQQERVLAQRRAIFNDPILR